MARGDEYTEACGQAVQSLAEHYRDAQTRRLLEELASGGEDTEARRQAVESLAWHFGTA